MPQLTPASLKIHLLDVGTVKYGDCLVCELGDRRILIDGAHPGDYQGRDGRPSIPEQFEEIFGHAAPFSFDLLVVTHCHSDHIGCLPTLVEEQTIEARWALVADENLGFGHVAGSASPNDALSDAGKLAALLREEDYSHLPDDQLDQMIEDLVNLESRYQGMLTALARAGTKIVRYGTDDHRPVETAFRDFGLKILGPSREHLKICARAIAASNGQAANDIARTADADLVTIYRSIVGQADAAGAEDRPGKGAALNNQSIVIKLSVGDATALLAGDMQFAKPEVSGLAAEMKLLRAAVKSAGPYFFIKLTHHSSYNGFDESLLEEWSPTTTFAHTGGLNDAGHPDPGVLQLLEENTDRLHWARTDRNGQVTVTFPSGGPKFKIGFGKLNDPTPNGDEQGPIEEPVTTRGTGTEIRRTVVRSSPGQNAELSAMARVGTDVSRVTVTFDIVRAPASPTDTPRRVRSSTGTPQGRRPEPLATPRLRLAAGRTLPKLLFLTARARLENNVGVSEAAAAIEMIQTAGQTLYQVQNQAAPWAEVRSQLSKGSYAGVVILGGYDVLPSQRLDVLPPDLRSRLTGSSDADNFIVWNDEAYGDQDQDSLPEIPVSRIPDAKSSRLVFSALSAPDAAGKGRFGVRNVARPFAGEPYAMLPGTAAILISQLAVPATVGAERASGGIVYFMLHGSDSDATRFWGEDESGGLEAVNLSNIPANLAGVVFAGCCWGALTVEKRASIAVNGQSLGIRTPGTSMALSYLRAGVKGFVGCTGTHYSPTVSPYNYFGGPMHKAFFKNLLGGSGPAQSLFDARAEYASGMPHGQPSAVGMAIELKIWKQFTCLGLGW